MNITIQPGMLSGTVTAIPSKSQAHRLLICAAFSKEATELICPDTNQDIEATVGCLNSLGATILRTESGYRVTPVKGTPEKAILNCHESGSTLRFMLPIVGALGIDGTFVMAGRLPNRPLSPLWEEMERMGCSLSRPTANTIRCCGQLKPGNYSIDGSISSQFITGLLFALSLMREKSHLAITGKIESGPYIDMTKKAMSTFGVDFDAPTVLHYHSPGRITVEGDWSNGAFFLGAQALGNPITVTGLSSTSPQGDRSVAEILPLLADTPTISAADIPDLVPILAVVAGAKKGAVFTDIRRLRLKESDRVASVIAMLSAIGGKAEATDNTLTVFGTGYSGGIIDSMGDHRIAMSAAIAASVCRKPVTILGAESVQKSYPSFWEEYSRLGGNYEFNLR